MCMYTHTHTYCRVLGCEPRGQDETHEGPEESRWTQSRHMCIKGSWMIFGYDHHSSVEKSAELENFGIICSSPVRFRPKTRQLKSIWIWANRPSSKGSKITFPVIKAIEINSYMCTKYLSTCTTDISNLKYIWGHRFAIKGTNLVFIGKEAIITISGYSGFFGNIGLQQAIVHVLIALPGSKRTVS